MPIVIKSNELHIKNGNSYMTLDAVADATTEERLNQINNLLSPPGSDGTYILQCTVVNGTPSYTWITKT